MTKIKCSLLFLLLLLPSMAFAGSPFDISCDNITSIYIIRGNDQFLKQPTPQGIYHAVTFSLKPEARDGFRNFVEASQQAQLSHDAREEHAYTALSITANGKPLQCDIKEIRGYGGTKVCTFILREKDAFDTARAVCPTAPIELIIVPQMPGQGRLE